MKKSIIFFSRVSICGACVNEDGSAWGKSGFKVLTNLQIKWLAMHIFIWTNNKQQTSHYNKCISMQTNICELGR